MEGTGEHDGVSRSRFNRIVRLNYILIALVVVVFVFAVYVLTNSKGAHSGTTVPAATAGSNNASGSFGRTIAGINRPFNATELATINNAPDSYFEKAGELLLNNSLADFQYPYNVRPVNKSYITSGFSTGGKPSVIFIGALSCIFCGENRWAMALALSRFGSFGSLYYGYSALGDGDLPTIYFEPYNYTTPAGVAFGDNYTSSYVNFISAEYESPITAGFEIQPLSYFISKAQNSTVVSALKFMNATGLFVGTPFTLWGNVLVPGADAVVLGDTIPTNSTYPLQSMTHAQVLQRLRSFNTQFAYSEYAAADIYAAYACATVVSKPSFCSLPAIQGLESVLNVSAG